MVSHVTPLELGVEREYSIIDVPEVEKELISTQSIEVLNKGSSYFHLG